MRGSRARRPKSLAVARPNSLAIGRVSNRGRRGWSSTSPLRRQAAMRHIAHLKAEFIQKLDDHEEEARDTLAALRRRLIGIGIGTFLATVFGGYLIISVGLLPLKKLSEAVSRVSPRDFRLPLDPAESLGSELDPIAARLRVARRTASRFSARETGGGRHLARTADAGRVAVGHARRRPPQAATAEEYRNTLVDCRGVGRQMRSPRGTADGPGPPRRRFGPLATLRGRSRRTRGPVRGPGPPAGRRARLSCTSIAPPKSPGRPTPTSCARCS